MRGPDLSAADALDGVADQAPVSDMGAGLVEPSAVFDQHLEIAADVAPAAAVVLHQLTAPGTARRRARLHVRGRHRPVASHPLAPWGRSWRRAYQQGGRQNMLFAGKTCPQY